MLNTAIGGITFEFDRNHFENMKPASEKNGSSRTAWEGTAVRQSLMHQCEDTMACS